ncbi:unnamed protein product [Caenorhabditis brenneri]
MSQISTHKPVPNAFTNEEEKAMWQFLRRKILNIKTGKIEKLEVKSKSELWEEFRSETNGTRRCRDYEKRFDYTMAPNLHKAELGLRTKTELYFGMDIPVESEFLDYLRQAGETEIDEANCLVKFREFKQGGLELESDYVEKEIKQEIETETPIKAEEPEYPEVSQEPECSNAYYERQRIAETPAEQAETHNVPVRTENEEPRAVNAFTAEEEMDMWIFLLQKLHNPRSGKVEKLRTSSKFSLWNEFRKITQSKRRPMEYEKRFTEHMAPALHFTDFDTKTKIELYYGLQIPVDPIFLSRLETSIEIQLDRDNLIEKYKDDEGLLLGSSATVINFGNNNNRGKTPRDDEPECSNAYYERERLEKQQANRRKPRMHETRSAYRQQNTNLQNCPVYVEMPLKTEPSQTSKKRMPTPIPTENVKLPHFTPEEEIDMWIFLLQKVRNSDTGKAEKQSVSSSYQLWNEFKTCSNGSKTAKEYMTRFELVMRDYLYLTRLTQQLKLELYFGLGLPVEPSLLDELKVNADVVVDRNGCLVMYKERRDRGEKFMLGVEEMEFPAEPNGAQAPVKQRVKPKKPNKKRIKNHVKLEYSSQEDSEYEPDAFFEDMSMHSDSSYIPYRPVNKRKIVSSDYDSEYEYTHEVIKRTPKKTRKPSISKVIEESEDEEDVVPEPPKFIRQPIAEKPYEGPFIQKSVYLNILKNVLTKIEEREEFVDLRKIVEEKIDDCEDKLISVGYMKHVIDSIFATSLYS